MATHVDQVYQGGTVRLDGDTFERCRFVGTTLVFGGGFPPSLIECAYEGISFTFDGAAANTFELIRAFSKRESGFQQTLKQSLPDLFA